MPLSAFALILLAGVIHASWNIAAKKANGDARFAFQSGVLMMLVWAPVGIALGWRVVPQWGAKEWGFVVLSGVLHVVYYVTLLRGYRKSDLTVVYPLARGSGPLLSSLVAILFLGERISLIGMSGIVGVVLGVFLVAGGPRLWRGPQDAVQRERVHKGIRYGILTGTFIAAYTVVDSYAVKFLAMSPILLDYFGNLVRVALLLPAALRDRPTTARLWREQWKYAMVVAVISPVSYVLVLYAVQQAPISHVAPAREVSMLFAALIGGHLLREGDRVLRLVGACFIAVGVIALALG
ncbi:DMT family transporter [Variovorax guangxiensis]|uniref:EamA family transporter n=1 Tax=Variovorax guangxiensis TaxID=1775474 RepID=A0A502DUZ5_9BURK|nr:DMT family transporter [Variovorax guangxiensis]RZI65778.1 MAG: EamA family transporter [Variovorax sp.]TPG24149.1 EamA family transporter [Variovorax ginsengisoli]TPG28399.1 EamA family transporter [Variovorax guangxiensis]